MENRLSVNQVNILRSCLRRGLALPEEEREMYAINIASLLKMSDVYLDTCYILADECVQALQKYESNIANGWRDDVAEEIQWWWAWTQKLRANGTLENWGNLRKGHFPFERFLPEFDTSNTLRVLNIGSGPKSTLGLQSSCNTLKVTDMDPLASAYNKVMGLLDVPGTGNIEFGAVEILSKLNLPKYSFISAKNCLDHAYDVPHGLEELVGCLADKGLIELVHFENEGEAQHYLGLHKWNIEIKDGKIHTWDRDRSHIFDHERHGLNLEYSKKVATKGSGAEHPQISIFLSRGIVA